MSFAHRGPDLALTRLAAADLSPTTGSGVILAEAVTFDPGVVVAFFLVLLLVGASWLVALVMGIVCGLHHGRDPRNPRAATVWWCCLALQVVTALAAARYVFGDGFGVIGVAAMLAPGASIAAFLAGQRQQTRQSLDRSIAGPGARRGDSAAGPGTAAGSGDAGRHGDALDDERS